MKRYQVERLIYKSFQHRFDLVERFLSKDLESFLSHNDEGETFEMKILRLRANLALARQYKGSEYKKDQEGYELAYHSVFDELTEQGISPHALDLMINVSSTEEAMLAMTLIEGVATFNDFHTKENVETCFKFIHDVLLYLESEKGKKSSIHYLKTLYKYKMLLAHAYFVQGMISFKMVEMKYVLKNVVNEYMDLANLSFTFAIDEFPKGGDYAKIEFYKAPKSLIYEMEFLQAPRKDKVGIARKFGDLNDSREYLYLMKYAKILHNLKAKPNIDRSMYVDTPGSILMSINKDIAQAFNKDRLRMYEYLKYIQYVIDFTIDDDKEIRLSNIYAVISTFKAILRYNIPNHIPVEATKSNELATIIHDVLIRITPKSKKNNYTEILREFSQLIKT